VETVIKEKLASGRSDSNNLFVFLMVALTGTATVFFKILTNEVSLWFVAVGVFGIIIAIFTIDLITSVRRKIDDLINELENLAVSKDNECPQIK
jgi:uncharacterized membrane protein YccC